MFLDSQLNNNLEPLAVDSLLPDSNADHTLFGTTISPTDGVMPVHNIDAIALRQLIDKLIGDRPLADSIAQQGHHDAQANFSLETILQSFEAAISSI